MELHPRHEKRILAEVEHSARLLEIIQKYDLTYGETISILSSAISRWAGYLKKDEDKLDTKKY